jgi:hypothetical protein
MDRLSRVQYDAGLVIFSSVGGGLLFMYWNDLARVFQILAPTAYAAIIFLVILQREKNEQEKKKLAERVSQSEKTTEQLREEIRRTTEEKHKETTHILTKTVEFSASTLKYSSEFLEKIAVDFKDAVKFDDKIVPDTRKAKDILPNAIKANLINRVLRDLVLMFEGDSRGADDTASSYPHNYFKAALFETVKKDGKTNLERTYFKYPDGIRPDPETGVIDAARGGVHSFAFKSGKIETVEDVEAEAQKPNSRWVDFRPNQRRDYKSMVCVPIKRNGDTLGILVIDTNRERYFLEDQFYRIFLGRILSPFQALIVIASDLQKTFKDVCGL